MKRIEPQFNYARNHSSETFCHASTMVELGERLDFAMKARSVNITGLAAAVGMSYQGIRKIVRGETKEMEASNCDKIAGYLHISSSWLATGKGEMETAPKDAPPAPTPDPIGSAAPGSVGTGTIDVAYAKGSCGGGAVDSDFGDEVREQLVKEAAWFKKYNVRPSDIFAVYADGDSMADFIVDGDIVIFKRDPASLSNGIIYAIDTPDGLRVKRVHKRSDGTVVLSSDNGNKRRYPDEEYSPEKADMLKIKGTFVYRQGG